MLASQMLLNFEEKITITFNASVYDQEKSKIGYIRRLVIPKGTYEFGLKKPISFNKKSTFYNSSNISFDMKLSKDNYDAKNSHYFSNGNVKNIKYFSNFQYELLNIQAQTIDGKSLRNAQKGAIYALLSHWSLSQDVATIVLPTGTGKTETMLVSTIADEANRVLVIVPTIDLKEQIANKFASWGILRDLNVIPKDFLNPAVLILTKILKNNSDISVLQRAEIIVSTPALIARAPTEIKESLKNVFSHVFFDEAHHIKAPEWNELKQLFKDAKIVQFTATPYRNDRKPIEGKIIYNYSMAKALNDGCFSKISLITVNEKNPNKKDQMIAHAAVDRLNEDRKKGYERHKILVRASSKAQAEMLFEKYKEWFPLEKIIFIHSESKYKMDIIRGIKQGNYSIVICVDMLKEGFDYPDFKIAAVHGMHKSLAVLLQFIGRFTRTQHGLGDASFVVNYAEENISSEMEELLQEGTGWEKVISHIADTKKEEAESIITFLNGCQPYADFDPYDIMLNPKLVYPSLSCTCFRAKSVDWSQFYKSFNSKQYSIYRPYYNMSESIFYFTTQKRDKVKWAKSNQIRDQIWNLIAVYFEENSQTLYISSSDKKWDMNAFVESITGEKAKIINGDYVFRSFADMKRLSIIHAGVFKPANHLHRYSKFSGSDVTQELKRIQTGHRCKKSDFVGIGYRDGFPTSIGASIKGKIWSPAKIGNLKDWKNWCINIGKMIRNDNINQDELLHNSAQKVDLQKYPQGIIVLSVDWNEMLYEFFSKITVIDNDEIYMLAECSIKLLRCIENKTDLLFLLHNKEIPFSIVLGGERGYEIKGLDSNALKIGGLKHDEISLKQFFEENPPVFYIADGSMISGCIHTKFENLHSSQFPDKQIICLDWKDVNYNVESMYKGEHKRNNSIQEYMMQLLNERDARIIFNDDNAGEAADIIAIFVREKIVRFELIHCKYSKNVNKGTRINDLYEVAGQVLLSLRYKWKPENLLKHIEQRSSKSKLGVNRFYKGSLDDIVEIRKLLRFIDKVEFEFGLAQPGISKSKLSSDVREFLGSIYSTVLDMTETELKCYFNE